MNLPLSLVNRRLTFAHDSGLAIVRAVWVVIVALTVVTYVAVLPARFQMLQGMVLAMFPAGQPAPVSPGLFALYHIALEVIFALVWLVTGLIIFRRRPQDLTALFIAFTVVMYGVRPGGFPIDAPRTILPAWQGLMDVLLTLSMVSSLIVFYLFPDGRFVPRWTVIPALVWIIWGLSWIVFPDSTLNLLRWSEEPVNTGALYLSQAVAYGTGVVALLLRYHSEASTIKCQQAKWVVFGLVTGVTAYFVLTTPHLVVPALHEPGVGRLLYGLVRKPLLFLALAATPVSLAVAILRYKLWNIDLIINRTLVYMALTALLGVIYIGCALVFQGLLDRVSGGHRDLAMVGSTLAIAGLFAPMRQRVQKIIDSSFYRSRYAAEHVLSAFSAAARDEVNLTRLMERLETTVWETLKPAHVLTWLRAPTGYSMPVFNEDDSDMEGAVEQAVIAFDDPLVQVCAASADLIDLDALEFESAGLERLRRGHVKYVAPLLHQGELVGWLSLGPRRDGHEYLADDRRFLAALSTQAAPALRAGQLVRQREEEAIERDRLQQELKFASVIQQTLLPQELPQMAGWELAVHYQPAGFVGGDFYDVMQLSNGHVALIVADVMDKGVPAALVMATTRAILRGSVRRLAEPAAVLERANELLYPEIPDSMYVTCLVAVLDPVSGRMRYANAGHNLPYRAAGGRAEELWAAGMPLGLMPGMRYEEHETEIGPGEVVLFYSDGVTEAHDAWGDMFGSERLRTVLLQSPGGCAALIRTLLDTLATFTGSAWRQEDDITVVALKRVEEGGGE